MIDLVEPVRLVGDEQGRTALGGVQQVGGERPPVPAGVSQPRGREVIQGSSQHLPIKGRCAVSFPY